MTFARRAFAAHFGSLIAGTWAATGAHRTRPPVVPGLTEPPAPASRSIA